MSPMLKEFKPRKVCAEHCDTCTCIVTQEGVFTRITCDHPDCAAELRVEGLWVDPVQLRIFAGERGWSNDDQLDYCGDHKLVLIPAT